MNLRMTELRILALVALLLLSACAQQNTRPELEWGSYEELLYQSYLKPGSALPQEQIEKLSSTIAKAERRNMFVAPGVYAHLGYMHYLNRNLTAARAAFEAELALYPESKIFIDRLLLTIATQEQE